MPKGLAMVGLPVGADVNAARASLQAALEKGLPFAEPYLNDIVHCTLLRLTGPLDAERTRRLLEIAEAHAGRGPLLGGRDQRRRPRAASWRMHPSELAGGVVFLCGGRNVKAQQTRPFHRSLRSNSRSN